jgi:hypothetical protein
VDAAKRKIAVTLDAELLIELRRHPGSVSSQLNEALRIEIERRRQRAALQRFLIELDDAEGPLDSPEDLADLERIERLWSELDGPGTGRRAS